MSTGKEREQRLGNEAAQKDREVMQVSELYQLQSHLIQRRSSKTETDYNHAGANFKISHFNIASTALSILMRCAAVFFNLRLAFDFYQRGDTSFFTWTVICITLPLGVTSLIHCYMCYEDGQFKKGFASTVHTCSLVLLSSVFLRDWNSLVYAIRCKRAELNGDLPLQQRYYKLTIREESDVAFIRLFECFLESAPQKILQMSIVLRQEYEITYLQAIVICMHFGSMAWCLATYHRSLRYSQEDKFNINIQGLICQLCWHFCISVSRTLCIAFVVSLFPFWTVVWCATHALLLGILIFAFDRPKSPGVLIMNLFFCLVFGFIYIFTYISTRDEPTRNKYIVYYTLCFMENITCIALFAYFAIPAMKSLTIVFYMLCSSVLFFYFLGILIMIAYYTHFHPQITARTSKRIINNK